MRYLLVFRLATFSVGHVPLHVLPVADVALKMSLCIVLIVAGHFLPICVVNFDLPTEFMLATIEVYPNMVFYGRCAMEILFAAACTCKCYEHILSLWPHPFSLATPSW
jgi:hypothetical protein